jgi:hypothetical protein
MVLRGHESFLRDLGHFLFCERNGRRDRRSEWGRTRQCLCPESRLRRLEEVLALSEASGA